MLTIRLDSAVSLVDQIALGLRRLIAAERLAPGDELPTVRQLAADLGVNLNTVARAYRALEDQGLVTSVRGRGTCVASSSQRTRGTPAEARRVVEEKLRDALAEGKLARLGRAAVEELTAKLIDEFWTANTPNS